MRIHVASLNQTKIKSVVDAVALYPELFKNADVVGVQVALDQFGHPKTLDETVEGAKSRAVAAFKNCDYSIGLEGGLMASPETLLGFVEVNSCIIYDGKNFYHGLSQAFEWPPEVTKFILAGKGDASQAFRQLGYTVSEKLGSEPGGIIGWLTGQRTTREQFMLESIKMALIKMGHPKLYNN